MNGLPKRHKTPEWLDELFERENITAEEYYRELGVDRKEFWASYWQLNLDFWLEEETDPPAGPEDEEVEDQLRT